MLLQDNLSLKSMLIQSHIDANMMDILSMEKYRVAIKPNFETACWFFDFPTETNNIYVGDKIFERTKEGFNDNQKIVNSYFIHEAAHSIFTTKDLVGLQKKLKEEKLNFKMFNLFEDARIEYKIREIFGFNFNWTDFEGIPEDDKKEKPSTTLFKIIQTEDRLSFDVPYYEKVKQYYDKIVKSKTENEIIQLMIEWSKDFPNDTEPEHNKNMSNENGGPSSEQEEGKDKGNGQKNGKGGEDKDKDKGKGNRQENGESNEELSDLELAASLQGNPDNKDSFDCDIETIVGDAKAMFNELEQELAGENNSSVKILDEVKCDSNNQLEASNSSSLFMESSYDMNKVFADKIDKAEERLKRILKSIDIETVNSLNHDKKFNMKGVVQALNGNTSAKPYKKSVEESYEDVKKKVFILMDGSASMGGLPVKNMRTFSVVANRLSALNLFEGWIGGSKVVGTKAVNQAFTLPIDDGLITSFKADAQGEGLGYAIEQHIDCMKQSDYVFILTDGQINDKDLAILNEKHPEVYDKTIGIYMGEKKHSNEKMLNEWFKNVIVDSKLENVIEEIVYFLEPNSNPRQKLLELEANKKIQESKEEHIEQTFNFNRI